MGGALEQGAGSLVGVDASEAQLRLARERVGGRAALVCADIESWDIPGVFDLVVCSLLLHHIVDLDATLRSCRDRCQVRVT